MKKYLLTLSCLMLTAVANGAEKAKDHSHDDSHGSSHKQTKHEAHEHGVASMNLARLGKEVQIEISTPSFNFLGFEHEPNTAEQKATVSRVEKILNKPSMLFAFEGAKCAVEHVSVESPFEKEDHHDEDHKEKEESGHSHKHESEENHDDEPTHSEYNVVYHFDCESAEGVLNINAGELFTNFPNFSKINTQWLSDNKQGSVELTSENKQLSIN